VVEIGQAAPHLKLPATSGGEVDLSEAFARNRATILAFYVLDFTPG
jgi:peroxiredoxin